MIYCPKFIFISTVQKVLFPSPLIRIPDFYIFVTERQQIHFVFLFIIPNLIPGSMFNVRQEWRKLRCQKWCTTPNLSRKPLIKTKNFYQLCLSIIRINIRVTSLFNHFRTLNVIEKLHGHRLPRFNLRINLHSLRIKIH